MGMNEIKIFFHIKGNYKKNEKAFYTMSQVLNEPYFIS